MNSNINKVALVIIYNHQFNKNIEILERIYKDRFTNIFHLVPFYEGKKSNVIPVYESSFYFQGYVAQGYKSYFHKDFTHYFFIADDLILNPVINEKNYFLHLKLGHDTCFIPRLSPINESKEYWSLNISALLYNIQSPGVEAKTQLPDFNEGTQLLKNFGIENKPLKFNQLWETPGSFKDWYTKIKEEKMYLLRFLKNRITKKKYILSYPLVRSYSDIFVVSADALEKFCHYCGVFASTKLFVELALPTSMIFSANAISTEKDLLLTGKALWTKKDYAFLDKYDNNLKKLLDDFPADCLYIHPVKLSRWNTSL